MQYECTIQVWGSQSFPQALGAVQTPPVPPPAPTRLETSARSVCPSKFPATGSLQEGEGAAGLFCCGRRVAIATPAALPPAPTGVAS